MLTNISTQATLLLGFALATYGADLLPYILNDDSPFCLYKNEASMFVGFIFLLSNTCCVCFCMMVLIASSLLVIQSQNAYLLVGGEVAVWRTQQLSSTVFYWYGLALLCFLLDAVLLGWIFLGFPHWLPNPNPGLNSEDVMTTDGQELLRCIDPTDPLAHARRDTFGAGTPPSPPSSSSASSSTASPRCVASSTCTHSTSSAAGTRWCARSSGSRVSAT